MGALPDWSVAIADQVTAALLVWSWQALALLTLVWLALEICRIKRRIEMILNLDRARVVAQQWKYLLVAAGLIACIGWLLIPGGSVKSCLAQQPVAKVDSKPIDTLPPKAQKVKDIAKSKGFDGLVETVLTNSDPELRQQALLRLVFFDREKNTGALVKLCQQSSDPIVKEIIIHSLGRRVEIEPLTAIAETDPSPDFRQLASNTLKWLQETGDGNEIKRREMLARQKDLPPPPPPPPPPGERNMTVSNDAEPQPRSDQPGSRGGFTLIREIAYAQLRRDPAVLERILADDYIGTDSTGAVYNRAQEVAAGRGFDYAGKRFEFDGFGLSGDGEITVAHFLGSVYSPSGVEPIAQYRYIATLAKRRGQLKVVAIHMSRKQ